MRLAYRRRFCPNSMLAKDGSINQSRYLRLRGRAFFVVKTACGTMTESCLVGRPPSAGLSSCPEDEIEQISSNAHFLQSVDHSDAAGPLPPNASADPNGIPPQEKGRTPRDITQEQCQATEQEDATEIDLWTCHKRVKLCGELEQIQQLEGVQYDEVQPDSRSMVKVPATAYDTLNEVLAAATFLPLDLTQCSAPSADISLLPPTEDVAHSEDAVVSAPAHCRSIISSTKVDRQQSSHDISDAPIDGAASREESCSMPDEFMRLGKMQPIENGSSTASQVESSTLNLTSLFEAKSSKRRVQDAIVPKRSPRLQQKSKTGTSVFRGDDFLYINLKRSSAKESPLVPKRESVEKIPENGQPNSVTYLTLGKCGNETSQETLPQLSDGRLKRGRKRKNEIALNADGECRIERGSVEVNKRLSECAYMLWSSEHRNQLEKDNPTLSKDNVDCIMQTTWAKMKAKDRLPYMQRAKSAVGASLLVMSSEAATTDVVPATKRGPKTKKNSTAKAAAESPATATALPEAAGGKKPRVANPRKSTSRANDRFFALSGKEQNDVLREKMAVLQMRLSKAQYLAMIDEYKIAYRDTKDAVAASSSNQDTDSQREYLAEVSRRILYGRLKHYERKVLRRKNSPASTIAAETTTDLPCRGSLSVWPTRTFGASPTQYERPPYFPADPTQYRASKGSSANRATPYVAAECPPGQYDDLGLTLAVLAEHAGTSRPEDRVLHRTPSFEKIVDMLHACESQVTMVIGNEELLVPRVANDHLEKSVLSTIAADRVAELPVLSSIDLDTALREHA